MAGRPTTRNNKPRPSAQKKVEPPALYLAPAAGPRLAGGEGDATGASGGGGGGEGEAATMRLNKYLSQYAGVSRRAADAAIAEGRVRVNGAVVPLPGPAITPGQDAVELDERAVTAREAEFRYILLYKPRGYITTASDPEGRKTVFDLLSGVRHRVVPVGRLDKDSEGMLLLTNDGELTHRLMHPSYGVTKTYRVTVNGDMTLAELDKLAEGVELEDGPAKAVECVLLQGTSGNSRALVTIAEGRNRQVRRMFEAIGREVRRLVRVQEGSLSIHRMEPGSWRDLTPAEVNGLCREVDLPGRKKKPAPSGRAVRGKPTGTGRGGPRG